MANSKQLISPKTRIILNLFLPQRRKPNPKYSIRESDKDLRGKTIVFTGGTNGIGRVAVEMLYKMGAKIVLLGRSEPEGQIVTTKLNSIDGQGSVSFQLCNLVSMQSVKNCSERIYSEHNQIDVLVNCAGVNFTKPIISKDGIESNWAVNYFGPYLLTHLLLDRIKNTASARIVNLTTNTDFIDEIDFNDIETTPNFRTEETYTESKLSVNMFSIDLAKKLEGTGITVNYLYPGYIKSNLLKNLQGSEKIMQFFMKVMASPTEVGADRIVRLAISSAYQNVSGAYIYEDVIKPPHSEAQNVEKRKQLKQITEKVLSKWL